MSLQKLNGKKVLFGGVYETTYKIKDEYASQSTGNVTYVLLDGKIYRFREDPSDGYRSHIKDIQQVKRTASMKFSMEHDPQRVFVHYGKRKSKDGYSYGNAFDGLTLYRGDPTLLAEFGTDNSDDYYPTYISFVDCEKFGKVKTDGK